MNLEVRNGDQVRIVLEPRHLLKASFIVYGYPVLAAVFAAIVARNVGTGDAGSAVAALSGLIIGILIAKFRLGKSQCLREFTPTVVERLASVTGK